MDENLENKLASYKQLYNAIIKRNENLQDFIKEIITELSKVRPKWDTENDVRITIFFRMRNVLMNSKLSLINLLSNQKIREISPPEQIIERLNEYDKFIRFSFFQNLMSQIESGIRVIMRSIDPTAYYSRAKGSNPFKNIYKFIIDYLHLNQFEDIFKMFRLIRNSIHNNGMFFPDDKKNHEINYRGNKYLFKNEEPISCADWITLTSLTEDMLAALKEIVLSPELDKYESIYDPIPKI